MASAEPDGKGRWIIRAYLGHAIGADGKSRPVQRRRRIDARTKTIALREAQAWEARLQADGRALHAEPGTDRSVRAVAEAWLLTIDPVARPKYYSESKRLLEADVYPVLGDKHVGRVTVAELERFWRWMGSQGKSAASIRAAAVALNQVWKVAVRYGWADSNPVKDAHRPTYRAPQISPPSRDEVMAILAAARDRSPVDARLFVVAAGSGLRRGELAAMRPSRLRDGRMVVDAAVSAVRGDDGVPIVKDPKTHQRRTVDLSPATVRAVVEQLVWLRDRARRAGVELVDDPWLWSFDLRGGVPPSPDYLSHAFSAACRLAGVKGVRLHDLRHFFATQSLAEGHAIPTVSGALGHRDSATTLRIYAHPDEAAMASLPGWVDEALGLTPELEA